MEKEIIEKYIKFAIDNGYEVFICSDFVGISSEYRKTIRGIVKNQWYIRIDLLNDCDVPETHIIDYSNYCNTITSKEFIEAIARGKLHNLGYEIKEAGSSVLDFEIKNITHTQADAIRDGSLEEFIKNLIK